jgi:signal transduction histidine kinase
VDFFSLVAWQRQSQENYRISVARVAHDVRTPLQVIVWDLEEAEKFFRSDPTRRGFFARSIQRAMAAQEHLRRLTDSSAPPWKSLNLAWLLKEIMEDLHPMAHNHPCKLMPHGAWPDEIRVRGDSHQLNTAMTNLLDNAIKYSLTGRVVDGRYVPYEVRVSIDSCENNMVRVTISNFGVGIPPALLERIRSPGGRALVHGGYREQSGTGLGLPSAIGILENHGGWLNIHSNPADLGPRASEEEYHRYVTSIEAYLPRIR